MRRTTISTALAIGLPMAGQAMGHAVIIDSVPAPLGHVQAGHLDVTLRYNSRIDAARSKLLLRHAGEVRRLAVAAGDSPDTLRAQSDLKPGEYEVRWQVLATDGHVTRGRIPFTVDAAAQGGAAR